MPAPTPRLLFRPMAALAAFKLHHPRPLSSREAKQLLNLLTSSFRQHLETEHGSTVPLPETDNSRIVEPLITQSKPLQAERRLPTDRHLHAILTDPLFKYNRTRPEKKKQMTRRPPLDVFEDACARGLMNIYHAKTILYAQKSIIISSSVPSVRFGMKESGAGRKVLKWLVSSGEAHSLHFLEDEAFTSILAEFLVAEGLHDVLWSWLERAISEHALHGMGSPKVITIQSFLYAFIKAEATGFVSLDRAYRIFGDTAELLTKLETVRRQVILGKAGKWLVLMSNQDSAYRPLASPSAFDNFLRLVPVFVGYPLATLARLHLHHPVTPTAYRALRLLEKLQQEIPRGTASQANQSINKSLVIRMALETAKYLLERNEPDKAYWVMNFLQEFYPQEIGANQKPLAEQAKAQAKAEAASLEILQGLEFA